MISRASVSTVGWSQAVTHLDIESARDWNVLSNGLLDVTTMLPVSLNLLLLPSLPSTAGLPSLPTCGLPVLLTFGAGVGAKATAGRIKEFHGADARSWMDVHGKLNLLRCAVGVIEKNAGGPMVIECTLGGGGLGAEGSARHRSGVEHVGIDLSVLHDLLHDDGRNVDGREVTSFKRHIYAIRIEE
jgi:hypothetical protein